MAGRGLVAAGALVAALIAVAVVVLGGGSDYEVKLRFENASQLVKGNEVRVGGVAVGTISDIVLADDDQAEVTVKLTDSSATPLRAGTTARVRIASLSGVANRFIALSPAAKGRELESGSTIPSAQTRSQVELDSVLNTLTAATRGDLQELLRGGAEGFGGAENAANTRSALRVLAPALSRLDAVAVELGRDEPALRRFLVQSAAVVGAVAERDPSLDAAIVGAATTARTLADRRAELGSTLRRAPATLGQATRTIRDLEGTFRELRPTARLLRPVAPKAADLVDDLQPLLRDGAPALRGVRALLPDLRTALARTPGLRRAALPAFGELGGTLAAAQPIVDGLLPYVPDVFHGIITGFGGSAVQSYDANGSYARIIPVVGQFSLVGTPAPIAKGLPLGEVTGLTRRCPGAAYERAPDGSSPLTPDPATCDPEQAP